MGAARPYIGQVTCQGEDVPPTLFCCESEKLLVRLVCSHDDCSVATQASVRDACSNHTVVIPSYLGCEASFCPIARDLSLLSSDIRISILRYYPPLQLHRRRSSVVELSLHICLKDPVHKRPDQPHPRVAPWDECVDERHGFDFLPSLVSFCLFGVSF
jgi:hypothetical protein